ncbi:54S ribosomal protein L4 mitochondrial [Exophiala xenobiotica]|nr:54S ribosomal protein L4 mitochondrial [Exophiala xenobiotica]KAK5251647.1 54S ribosomal protein L4 mitochondrial [Exophiala xenobiotica]KAK5323976.1 54S ribosomal protein L4 mitochondrial [Exophiala xenobiotica]KAK5355302.1 54S ribosomal protein L4 mitochondrial [Exophiala xenobiotica]KAK5368327.1 54S ribosomal protein L4 mitochondrial [Exophiala xenobiotica]
MASLSNSFARSAATVPVFLAPAFARPTTVAATAVFYRLYASSSKPDSKPNSKPPHPSSLSRKPGGDRNKQRGVSALRRTGPRRTRGLWQHPLPVPVARDHRGTAPEYKGAEDHGLWGFFNRDKKAMMPPEEESSRSWSYAELSNKSFEDLQKLYWVCVKEQNCTMTREKERTRVRAGYGELEHQERLEAIRKTMYTIRDVLADRQLSWNQAQALLNTGNINEILADPEPLEESWEDIEEAGLDESPPAANKQTLQHTPISAA